MTKEQTAVDRPHWPRASGPKVWKLSEPTMCCYNPTGLVPVDCRFENLLRRINAHGDSRQTGMKPAGTSARDGNVLVSKPRFHRRKAGWGHGNSRLDSSGLSCQKQSTSSRPWLLPVAALWLKHHLNSLGSTVCNIQSSSSERSRIHWCISGTRRRT